jgi:hypothetical protein
MGQVEMVKEMLERINKKIVWYLFIVCLVAVIIYVVSTNQLEFSKTPIESKDNNIVYNITINITSETWSLRHTYSTTKNSTVYDLLNETATQYNFSIQKTFFPGYDSFFIESINNIENGQDNNYWQYKVNDKYAEKGCSSYHLSDNDIVTWNFKKSPY